MVYNFYEDLGVHTNFISIYTLMPMPKQKSTKKVILKGLKKKLDDAKSLWI